MTGIGGACISGIRRRWLLADSERRAQGRGDRVRLPRRRCPAHHCLNGTWRCNWHKGAGCKAPLLRQSTFELGTRFVFHGEASVSPYRAGSAVRDRCTQRSMRRLNGQAIGGVPDRCGRCPGRRSVGGALVASVTRRARSA